MLYFTDTTNWIIQNKENSFESNYIQSPQLVPAKSMSSILKKCLLFYVKCLGW